MPSTTELRVAVVGAGSIGTSWAIVFAAAGIPVNLFDTNSDRRLSAIGEIKRSLNDLDAFDLLDHKPAEVLARISVSDDLQLTVQDAQHVQECIPEDLTLKKEVFSQLDHLTEDDVVLASSTSFLPASAFAPEGKGGERCLVVHPGNPPHLLRVAEIVPASFTRPEVVERTSELLSLAGMTPVRLHHEVNGFAFNRLQGALLREAYCLVRDGVITPDEIDLLVRDGLGLRWSVVGPFESVDLNTRGGVEVHASRMGPHYLRMGLERGQNDPWTKEMISTVSAARRQQLSLDDWSERVAWRDRRLMELLRLKKGPMP